MVLSPVAMLQKYLGIREVVNEISKKEKFCKKKQVHGCFWVGIRKGEYDDDEFPSHTQLVSEKKERKSKLIKS